MTETSTDDFKKVVDMSGQPVGDYRPGPRGLKEGGGGSTFGGMPPDLPERVAVLETHVEHIRGDLGALKTEFGTVRTDVGVLKVDVATIKENIRHLPTKGWAVGALVTLVALIGGLIAIAPKLQKWVGSI